MSISGANPNSDSDAVYRSLMAKAARGDLPFSETGGGPSFMLESPKAVIKQSRGAGGRPRAKEAPKARIAEMRAIRKTDPHVAELVNTLIDYLVGSGGVITPANIPYTDTEQTDEDIADFKVLIENSDFEAVTLPAWVDEAITTGTGFLETVVEDERFKPKILPTERMSILTDEFGNTTGYEMENPGGGEPIEFAPYDLAVLRFVKFPGEDFGRSLIEPIEEHVNMLRDMEIDLARFVATKAYPPVIWKLGTDERPWNQTQIQDFIDSLRDIEPDSMIGVGHDVEHDVVGVTSTSSKAGAMNLDSTFAHLLNRIHVGIGVPEFLNGGGNAGRNSAVATMPKFDRRIQRFRLAIRQAVRYQIFVSILGHPSPEDYAEIPPDFEFGQHSSEEERLETEEALKLFSMGFLKREAFAARVGIDPETEMPGDADLQEVIDLLTELSGAGDRIQNPEGGRPTDTGTGERSSGRSVATRQNPERPTDDDSRPQRDIGQE
ncbi:phage portal protein family protein [Haloplanus salinus]|nr:hypothetical protein [Haloplanus salinus]